MRYKSLEFEKFGGDNRSILSVAKIHGNEDSYDFDHVIGYMYEERPDVSLIMIPEINKTSSRYLDGTDLNRDWRAFESKKTRELRDFILKIDPLFIVDHHEWLGANHVGFLVPYPEHINSETLRSKYQLSFSVAESVMEDVRKEYGDRKISGEHPIIYYMKTIDDIILKRVSKGIYDNSKTDSLINWYGKGMVTEIPSQYSEANALCDIGVIKFFAKTS